MSFLEKINKKVNLNGTLAIPSDPTAKYAMGIIRIDDTTAIQGGTAVSINGSTPVVEGVHWTKQTGGSPSDDNAATAISLWNALNSFGFTGRTDFVPVSPSDNNLIIRAFALGAAGNSITMSVTPTDGIFVSGPTLTGGYGTGGVAAFSTLVVPNNNTQLTAIANQATWSISWGNDISGNFVDTNNFIIDTGSATNTANNIYAAIQAASSPGLTELRIQVSVLNNVITMTSNYVGAYANDLYYLNSTGDLGYVTFAPFFEGGVDPIGFVGDAVSFDNTGIKSTAIEPPTGDLTIRGLIDVETPGVDATAFITVVNATVLSPATAAGSLTVSDYTQLTGAIIRIGGTETYTEGVEWTAVTDNDTTAANIASAIGGVSIYVTANAVGPQVQFTAGVPGSAQNAITLEAGGVAVGTVTIVDSTLMVPQTATATLTVDDYTQLRGVSFLVDGFTSVSIEGHDWFASDDNDTTAASIGAINTSLEVAFSYPGSGPVANITADVSGTQGNYPLNSVVSAYGDITIGDPANLAGATITIDGTGISFLSVTYTEGIGGSLGWTATPGDPNATALSLANAIMNASGCVYVNTIANKIYLVCSQPGAAGDAVALVTSNATDLAISGPNLINGSDSPGTGFHFSGSNLTGGTDYGFINIGNGTWQANNSTTDATNFVPVSGDNNATAANLQSAMSQNTGFTDQATPTVVGAVITMTATAPGTGGNAISIDLSQINGMSSTPFTGGTDSTGPAVAATGSVLITDKDALAGYTLIIGSLSIDLSGGIIQDNNDDTADALATYINGNSTEVTALSGNPVALTASTPGAAGNSLVLQYNNGSTGLTISGATLTGGSDATPFQLSGPTLTGGTDYGTLTIDGQFIQAGDTAGSNTFTVSDNNGTADNIRDCINGGGVTTVTAVSASGVVTMTYNTAGTEGNAATINVSSSNGGITRSGAAFTGGVDPVTVHTPVDVMKVTSTGLRMEDTFKITNLPTPTDDDDAATKTYVDTHGLSFPILAPDGSVSAPSYSFAGVPQTGLYAITGELFLHIVSNNAEVVKISDVGFEMQPNMIIQGWAGQQDIPSYTFFDDNSSGLFWDSGNVCISTNFVERMRVTDTSLELSVDSLNLSEPSATLILNGSSGNIQMYCDTTSFNVDSNTIPTIMQANMLTGALLFGYAVSRQVVTITNTSSPFPADDSRFALLGDASSGAVVFNLIDATTVPGRLYVIKKIDNSLNTVTVTPTGGQTIDGQPNYVLTTQYESITIIASDTGNWFII